MKDIELEKLKKLLLLVICAAVAMFCGYKIYDILTTEFKINLRLPVGRETV